MKAIDVIDNKTYRRISKVVSIISIIVMVTVVAYSSSAAIKYQDHPEFGRVTESQLATWKMLAPETYNLWQEYRSEYLYIESIFYIGAALFLLSGIPIWADNVRDPMRMFSEREKKVILKVKKWIEERQQNSILF